MSYLTKSNGVPDFTKVVISFWFKVQRETIERVAAEESSEEHGPPMMNVIPLVVFGQQFQGYEIITEPAPTRQQTETVKAFVGTEEIFITTAHYTVAEGAETLSEGERFDVAPSYIGINCARDDDTGETTAALRIRLQAKDFGAGSWVDQRANFHNSDYTSYSVANSATAPSGNAYDSALGMCVDRPDAGAPYVQTRTPVDTSAIYTKQQGPDSFEIGPTSAAGAGNDFMKIEPDQWHHLLLSFDLSDQTKGQGTTVFDTYHCSPTPDRSLNEIKRITNPCQIWIALDDVNRKGKALDDPRFGGSSDPSNRFVDGLGDNGIAPFYGLWTTFVQSDGVSANTWYKTGTRRVDDWHMGDMPTYTYEPGALPTNGQPLGIPGTPAMEERIRHVEMAEFQMFLDKALDTNLEHNRRAFIDFVRDDEGDPVVDENGKMTMLPVSPTKGTKDDPRAAPERLLGKKPEILLHTSNNWKKGKNTGTLGVEISSDGTSEEISSGQFTRTGRIDRYKPDPFLEKTE